MASGHKFPLGCLLLVCAALWPSIADAGQIVRKDGSVVYGQIVDENDKEVVIATSRKGMTLRMAIYRTEIVSIDKNAVEPPATPEPVKKPDDDGKTKPAAPPVERHAGPVYYRIPLRGMVGERLVAPILDEALADALTRSPNAVVLEMDSGGGKVSEVDRLVDVIAKYKKRLRIIVWIKEAGSAAAITSLCADEIYMRTGSKIGAATAYDDTPEGKKDVDEKFRSWWVARGRSIAELGNHSPLLGQGMIYKSGVTYLRSVDGKPEVSSKPQPGSSILKPQGQILTLTAQEAVNCGLAKAISDSTDELGRAMGFAGWTECEGIGTTLVVWHEKRLEAAAKEWTAIKGRLEAARTTAEFQDPAAHDDYVGPKDAESVRKWNMRSNLCAEALKKADRELTRLLKIANDYPELHLSETECLKDQGDIRSDLARLESEKMRVPAEGPKKRETENHPIIGGRP